MKTLNVLLVTYSFPPAGGVGSYARRKPCALSSRGRNPARRADRAQRIGRWLRSHAPQGDSDRSQCSPDRHARPSLRHQEADQEADHRRETANWYGCCSPHAGKPNFLKRALQDILLPDPQVTWLPVLTRAARRIIRKRNIDLVLITVPPFSSVLLVEKLRKEFPRLAIVVDFRDEWLSTTFDLVSFLFSRSERARMVARNAEASAVTNATAVVAVTEAARREIRARYPQEPDSKFHLIPNGFDATRLRRSASLAEAPARRQNRRHPRRHDLRLNRTHNAGSGRAIAAARCEVPIQTALHRPHRGASLPRSPLCNWATWLS